LAKTNDLFEMTVESYCDPRGAQGFINKETPLHEVRTAQAFGLLKGLDVKGMRILDVGCGYGRDVGKFRQMGAEAWGCDVSPALLEKARENYGNWFAVDDIRAEGDFPWKGPFDLVWCCSVLVHVPRVEVLKVLERMWSVIKPGGWLALWAKVGEGERVMTNLGEGLPRVMVYYQMEEILGPLKQWGGEIVVAEDKPAEALPTGDMLMRMLVRKPKT